MRIDDNIVLTHAILDNGSDTTLISDQLLKRMGVERKLEEVYTKTVHGSKLHKCRQVDVVLSSLDGKESVRVPGALSNACIGQERVPSLDEGLI